MTGREKFESSVGEEEEQNEQEEDEHTISLILCQVLMSDNVKEEKHPGVDACWAIVVPDINQILPRYVLHLKQKK